MGRISIFKTNMRIGALFFFLFHLLCEYDSIEAATTCQSREPCGWAYYVPGSRPRQITQWRLNNFCSCGRGNLCGQRYRDNYQFNAIEYICKPYNRGYRSMQDYYMSLQDDMVYDVPIPYPRYSSGRPGNFWGPDFLRS